MSKPESLQKSILDFLRSAGTLVNSPKLQTVLGVSQPTVHRALTALLRSGQILEIGAARARQYAYPRQIAGVDAVIPLTQVSGAGKVSEFGRLVPLHNGKFLLDGVDESAEVLSGLPWFMNDMCPQGFIGRSFSRKHPSLRLVDNPEHWGDDDVLRAITTGGEDLPGNLIAGKVSFNRYLELEKSITQTLSHLQFPGLALEALRGVAGTSSAGGEQPKFCTFRNGRHVLVKFSPVDDSEQADRTRDLLICEHLALNTLRKAGLEASESEIHIVEGQVFLEVVRFDRTDRGRVGAASLLTYDGQYVGSMSNWASTAVKMQQRRLLSVEDSDTLRLLEAFGTLIGNTDRHYGNISLIRKQNQWVLSPIYDMLPMVYAVTAGSIVARHFSPADCQPTTDTLSVWDKARLLAGEFWRAVAVNNRISDGFRVIADRHASLQWPHMDVADTAHQDLACRP